MNQPSKRPYERPTLEGASVFGADAMAGSCCRSATGCSTAGRNAQQITHDASKGRPNTAS